MKNIPVSLSFATDFRHWSRQPFHQRLAYFQAPWNLFFGIWFQWYKHIGSYFPLLIGQAQKSSRATLCQSSHLHVIFCHVYAILVFSVILSHKAGPLDQWLKYATFEPVSLNYFKQVCKMCLWEATFVCIMQQSKGIFTSSKIWEIF